MNPESSPRGIILIHSDQHRADCLSCAGHPYLKTPNLDRLAAEGLRFTNAFTAIPVCGPARASLMSGAWSFHHGSLANGDSEATHQIGPETSTWSGRLARREISLEYVGRWHVNDRYDPTSFGFRHYFSDTGYGAWRAKKGLPAAPATNGFFGEIDPYITPAQSKLGWLFDHALDRLEILSQEGQPFFLRIDPFEPHLPNRVPEPYASMYSPEELEPWGSFGETFAEKPFVQAQQLRTWGVQDWTWKDWAPVVARYLGEITLLDHQVGRVLDELERLGLADDVLVMYTSDHGDMCGAHRMVDKHYVMYDDVVKVPLLARWPRGIAPGGVANAFVSSTLDLAATFLDLFGEARPAGFAGSSLQPLFQEPERKIRPDIFSAYHGNQMGLFSQRMVANESWKYIWNATAEDEFYDRKNDPFELVNRASDFRAKPALDKMRRRMVECMTENRDPLLNRWTRASILGESVRDHMILQADGF